MELQDDETALAGVREALQRVPRMNAAGAPLTLSFADGALIIKGEVPDVAVKRRALDAAASVDEVGEIVDRLTVAPAEIMGDRQIRDQFRDVLYRETAFTDFMLIAVDRGSPTVLRRPVKAAGRIEYDVDRGIVTLNGAVPSVEHKRLAGVLAWWVPGRRDVINAMRVEAGEGQAAGTLADWVKDILDRDNGLDSAAIEVVAENGSVRLFGRVASQSARDRAEFDTWYVDGVDQVINDIEIYTKPR